MKKEHKPILILALVGPTASGKSEIAIQLAQKHNAEILSCDSLLVYKGLDIGTAKPTLAEQKEIPHHGIDIVDLNKPFTAGDYVRYARPIIDRCIQEKKRLLIVGGTGFYLRALLFGIWDVPPTQPEIRSQLEQEALQALPEGTEEERSHYLYRKLSSIDFEYAQKLKPNDSYRILRALEIIEASGSTVTQALSQKKLLNPLPYPYAVFGIKRIKLDLQRRIAGRTQQMFSKGIIKETQDLLRRYPQPPRPLHCVGYYEVLEHLAGRMTLQECRERVLISTRQLAKKQMTFFKTFPEPIHWFSLPSEEELLIQSVEEAFS